MRVYRSGEWWHSHFGSAVEEGPREGEVAWFQQEFAEFHGSRFGIATNSGTMALDVALRAAGLDPGDEVLVPAYTFVASATCILQSDLVPVFVDIDPESYNIDPDRVEEAISPRTRAIVAVDCGGAPADFDRLSAIAKKHSLLVVEDAAHAHGAEWRGRRAGSLGNVGTFSFQAFKSMTAGEGGIVTTSDRDLATEVESLVWAGRRQGGPWYEFHRLGWNGRLTEFQAALLRVQLAKLPAMLRHREERAKRLTYLLSDLPGVEPLERDPRVTVHSHHLFIVRFDSRVVGVTRDRFAAALWEEGIPASTGFPIPLYRNPLFTDGGTPSPLGARAPESVRFPREVAAACPVTERACREEAIWLPQNVLMGSDRDVVDVASAFEKLLAGASLLK